MVSVPKRGFVVVESCFEVIFRHADVVTCSSGCCRDYVSRMTSFVRHFPLRGQRSLFPQLHVFLLSVISHSIQYLFVMVFDHVCLFLYQPNEICSQLCKKALSPRSSE